MAVKKEEKEKKGGGLGDKIGTFLRKGAVKIGVYAVAISLLVLLFLFIFFVSMNAKYVKNITNGASSCIEANEFGSASKVIQSRPISLSDFITLSNTPRYEEFTERMYPTNLKLTLNGDPIIINITGKWTPWRMNDSRFEAPKEDFICLLEKKVLPDDKRFSTNSEENEFYYIKNYFKDISVRKNINGDIKVMGIADAPERQKNCWVTRGVGLYLGVYGPKGKTEPSAFHHLAASKMICNSSNWFNKKKFDNNEQVLTKYYEPSEKGVSGAKKVNYKDMSGALRTLYYDKSDLIGNEEYLELNNRIDNLPKLIKDTETKITEAEEKIKKLEEDINNEKNNPTPDREETIKDENGNELKDENGNPKTKKITSADIIADLNIQFEDTKTLKAELEKSKEELEKEQPIRDIELKELKIGHYNTLYFIEKEYTMGDFKRAYFTLDKYEKAFGDDSDILTKEGNQIIYNIEKHENLLYNNKLDGTAAYDIANAIAMFNKACYSLEKDENDNIIRRYNAYFQYGPKILYKNNSRARVPYDFGEVIKMLIVDKYYSDNYGFYNIEIVSGINFDDTGTISSRLQEVEFYLLGTPQLGQANDRADGVVAKIFNRLVDSWFAGLVRTVLGLYVVLFGYRIMFGFKKKNNDRAILKMSDMMIDLFKMCLIITIISPYGFQFFNKIVINFVINGTLGMVDLIAGILPNTLSNGNDLIALTESLKNASAVASFSRHFAIIDEILAFFKSDTILLKIYSLFFNSGARFFLGIPVGVGVFVIIICYAYKLTMVVIPFIFTLLQLTLVLPIAPLIFLFNFFEKTSYIFKNWLNFVLRKSLEILAFFTGFYFATHIMTNLIKKLLSFKVCFYKLGDYLYGTIYGKDINDLNFIQNFIKNALNNALFMEKSQLPDNFFLFYLINIALCFVMLSLFDTITKTILDLVGKIFVINGAKASDLGLDGNGTLSQFNVGKDKEGNPTGFGSLDQQMKDFNRSMGIATLQNSDALSWSKKIFDTNKGLFSEKDKQGKKVSDGNLGQTLGNIWRGASLPARATSNAINQRLDEKKMERNGEEVQSKGLGRMLRESFREEIANEAAYYLEEPLGEHSMFDIHSRNFGKPFGRYSAGGNRLNDSRLSGRNENYYNKKTLDRNRQEIERKRFDTVANLTDEEIDEKFNGEEAKNVKNLRNILDSIRKGRIKLSVKRGRNTNFEDSEFTKEDLKRISEYLDEYEQSKDKEKFKGEATELISEDTTKIINEVSENIIDDKTTDLIDEDTTKVLDIRVKVDKKSGDVKKTDYSEKLKKNSNKKSEEKDE